MPPLALTDDAIWGTITEKAQVHRGPAPHAAVGHPQSQPPSSCPQSPEGEPAVQSAGQDPCRRSGGLSATARGRGRRAWLALSCVPPPSHDPSVGAVTAPHSRDGISHLPLHKAEMECFYKTLTLPKFLIKHPLSYALSLSLEVQSRWEIY